MERSSIIKIGNREIELILTTKATKEISKRYGGIDKLGEKLFTGEDMAKALDEICWLIVLLGNQSIEKYNYENADKKELITQDYIELMTSPLELADCKTAITEAMFKGTKREIESEDDPKNAQVG